MPPLVSHFIPTGKYICSKTAYCLNTVSQFIILIRYPVPALPLFRNPAQRISFKLYLAILVFRLYYSAILIINKVLISFVIIISSYHTSQFIITIPCISASRTINFCNKTRIISFICAG